MEYRHTQTGIAAVAVWLALAAVFVVVLLAADGDASLIAGVGAFVVVIGVVVTVFSRLTVSVRDGIVDVFFGWGWPRRSFSLDDVESFAAVRNRWIYGWGIRKVPGGWMFNVRGLEAVELVLRSGKRFRIGTDEPADLIAALTLQRPLR